MSISTGNTALTNAAWHYNYNSSGDTLFSGACGENLTWTLDNASATLSIFGTGTMENYSYEDNAPWYAYRSIIEAVVVDSGVTSIGSDAFSKCENLVSVTLPDGMTTIGNYAFEDCTSLTSITIPNGVTSIGVNAFIRCTGLTSVSVSSGNTTYDSRNNCNAIIETATNDLLFGCQNTIIPDGVTSIHINAFYDCTGLASVTIPDTVTSIGYSSFSGCTNLASVTISDSVTSIGPWAFNDCKSLTSITIPDSVTSIGSTAFNDCTGLTSIAIPNSVTSIGQSAFSRCTGLTSVTIGNGVVSFGSSAFSGCTSLTSVTFSNGATSIGSSAFSGCTSLASVTIPDSVTSIGESAFNRTAWYNNQSNGVVYAGKVAYNYKGTMPENTEITLLPGTKGIADYAFRSCTNLTSVTIPDSVTSIGRSAFNSCTGLTSVTIGSGLTSIGTLAFGSCDSLTSITVAANNQNYASESGVLFNHDKTELIQYPIGNARTSYAIPDSVTSIGNYAFSRCTNLTSVTIPDSVTSIGERAFYGTAWYNNQPDGVVYAGKVAYEYKGMMPENTEIALLPGTKGVAQLAFYNCTGLTSLTIPDSVTSIGYGAFSGCSMTSVAIPDSVTSIGTRAFEDCTSLTSVTIGNSVTSIGEYTFSNCTNLSSVTIGNSVTSIGKYAFNKCKDLEAVNFTGTEAQWNEIRIDDGNEDLKNAAITFGNGSGSHLHVWDDGTVTTLPDCTHAGVLTYHCTVCDETKTETIPALGHDYNTVVTEPTCTDGGYTTYTCSRCGDSYTADETAALDHSWGEGVVTTEPSCASTGVNTFTCTVCGVTKTEPIAKDSSNHTGGTEVRDAAAATCSAEGYTGDTYCKGCGMKLQSGTEIAKTAHTEKEVRTEPTCTESGSVYSVCDVCGEVLSETTELSALGHSYNAVVTEPTMTTQGYTTYTCSRCGDSYTDDFVPPLNAPKMIVSNVKGKAGQTVDVTVSLANNPGIVAVKLLISYDDSVLTLTGVTDGSLLGTNTMLAGADLAANPYSVLWEDTLAAANYTQDGVLLTLSFAIHENAEVGTTPITLTYDAGSTFNYDLDDVAFGVVNGAVEITDREPGDANGDGVLNLKDVAIIKRALAGGFGVTMDESNADVNGDGVVNLKDVALIKRYLAGGFDVTLL